MAIDKAIWWHLLLPFKQKVLFILEYSAVRRMPWWLDSLFFLYSKTFIWETSPASRLIGAIVVQSYFPTRVGIEYTENASLRVTKTIGQVASLSKTSEKRYTLSCTQSNKLITRQQRQRVALLKYLIQTDLPLDFYGRDSVPIADKADCLIEYRYHLAIENDNAGPSEKLFDPLFCRCVVFYGGGIEALAPVVRKLVIPIDISDFAATYEIIRHEVATGEYRRSLTTDDWEICKDFLLRNHSLEGILSRFLSDKSGQGYLRGEY